MATQLVAPAARGSSDRGASFPLQQVSAPDASTFAPGLRLLPRALRPDVYRLYHVMRDLDDLVDEGHPDAERRVAAVEAWATGAEATSPEARALEALRNRHDISTAAVLDGCSALRDDLTGALIADDADLERYCRRTGGTMLVLLGDILGTAHPNASESLAILGAAVQLTNILRDIDEDSARRRSYIPRTEIARFGPPTPGEREELLRFEIARADGLYEEGLDAIALLRRGRRGIACCAALYRETLRQIEREGYGRRHGKVRVPGWRRRLIVQRHRLGLATALRRR